MVLRFRIRFKSNNILIVLCMHILTRRWHAIRARADWSKINDMAKSLCNSFISYYTTDTHIETLWNIFKDFCMSCLNNVRTFEIHWKQQRSPLDNPFKSSASLERNNEHTTKPVSVILQRIDLFTTI